MRRYTRHKKSANQVDSVAPLLRVNSLCEIPPGRIGVIKTSKLMTEDGGDDAVNSHLEIVAERYPDFPRPGNSCVGDGERKFVFLFNHQSIIDRVEATSNLITNPERKRLQKVAAAIVEIGAGVGDNPPIKFDDLEQSAKAWRELRRSFGVPIESESEEFALDLWDPEGAEVDEEDE
jgi:hypothetical protein